ncbi:TetR/AcrR family transcriptional regulator [Lacibacterium aquatile]|uniref:TetR/AcrR family transcriptional regulator n=1 Tax=Lacibacterium aquatile TaxID=1168082 RepID=A0ABW5DW53_9PROT
MAPTPPQPAETEKPKRAADRIRETARQLFYKEGIRAIGVDEIVNKAGVTKPSLYRSFSSKDDLAAAYLTDYEAEFWARFDAAIADHPGDAKAGFLAYFGPLSERAAVMGYRGCGLTNAAVEYPDREHPARQVSENNKLVLQQRLVDLARQMGARDPQALGDGLLLLIEGTFVTGQMFGNGGPSLSGAKVAEALIDAFCR